RRAVGGQALCSTTPSASRPSARAGPSAPATSSPCWGGSTGSTARRRDGSAGCPGPRRRPDLHRPRGAGRSCRELKRHPLAHRHAIRSSRPPGNRRSGMAADALLIYGTDEPLPEERTLRAGPLTAIFTGGALRSVKVRGVEVIRGLAFLVRDRNWGTLAPALS